VLKPRAKAVSVDRESLSCGDVCRRRPRPDRDGINYNSASGAGDGDVRG